MGPTPVGITGNNSSKGCFDHKEGVYKSAELYGTVLLNYSVNISGCYHNFTLSNGEIKNISSPGFLDGQNYPNNVKCTWTFSAPVGEKVSMTILSMDTELGYDVVRVMDGIGEEDDKLPILATMSGEEPHEAVISTSSEMTVIFTSDVNVNMTGLHAIIGALKKAGEQC